MNKGNGLTLALSAAALMLAACGGSSTSPTYIPPPPEAPPPPGEWALVWEDTFEGESIDPEKWSHEVNCAGGGNNELQCYTARSENSYVEDGKLHLVAREETFSGPGVFDDDPAYNPNDTSVTRNYTSARLRTKNNGDWKYGRLEINAKMPEGQGLWPAIWMLPTEGVHGVWPLSGEIDIFEAVNTNASGGNEIHGTLHYGRSWPNNVYTGQAYTPDENIWEDFNTYAIEWEEGAIRWYFNDTHYATQTSEGWFTFYWGGQETGYQLGEGAAPFDELFHLILNVAVGGQWPGSPNEETTFPQMMVVDYVRVYECSVNPETGKGCAANVMPGVRVEGNGGDQRQFSLYDDGPRTLSLRAHGIAISNTLEPALYEATSGNVSVDTELDIGDATVWDVQFNGPGNVFLLSGDMTDVNYVDDGFILAGMLETGEVLFDMRVIDIEEETELQVKLDSGWPNVSYRVIELPEDDEWTTVAVRFSDLQANNIETGQVDYNNIVSPFVLEAVGGTAHVQLNNIRIRCLAACGISPKLDGTVPEGVDGLDIFVEELSPQWSNPGVDFYTEGGQVIVSTIVEDADLGDVLQFEFNQGFGTMFIQGPAQDLSGFAGGSLVFDLKVLNAAGNTSGFLVKSDCVYPCSSNELSVPMPADNEWHTITISLAELTANSGFNMSNVNTPFSFWPVQNQQNGVRFRVANIRWLYPE